MSLKFIRRASTIDICRARCKPSRYELPNHRKTALEIRRKQTASKSNRCNLYLDARKNLTMAKREMSMTFISWQIDKLNKRSCHKRLREDKRRKLGLGKSVESRLTQCVRWARNDLSTRTIEATSSPSISECANSLPAKVICYYCLRVWQGVIMRIFSGEQWCVGEAEFREPSLSRDLWRSTRYVRGAWERLRKRRILNVLENFEISDHSYCDRSISNGFRI